MTRNQLTMASTPVPKQTPAESARVFLSYSRNDMVFVDRLGQVLAARGIEVYIDRTEIEKGVDWWERIRQLISKSDSVVFVLSPDAAQSAVCAREVAYAQYLGKRLVPVVHRPVDNVVVPAALANINYIFFADCDPTGAKITFEAAVDELVTTLLTDIEWVREHTRLGELARHWDAFGRLSDQLLRGRPLRDAVDWLHKTLERSDGRGLDESDVTHAFIQASAQRAYSLGLFGWRYRLMAYPIMIIVGIVVTIAVSILDSTYQLGLIRALGIETKGGLSEILNLSALFTLMLFAIYIAGSTRRRYLIARDVKYLGKWPARRFAFRTVAYNLLWLAAVFFTLYAYLNTLG